MDENIVAYIPESQLLFQGDFFRVPADRSRPERIRDEGVVFFQKIKDNGLVVKHLAGVHGAIGDMTDLEKSKALRGGGN